MRFASLPKVLAVCGVNGRKLANEAAETMKKAKPCDNRPSSVGIWSGNKATRHFDRLGGI